MTRTSKKLKTVISLLAVVIVLSSIAIVPVNAAFAQPFWVRSRAFVASALAALNIVTQSATMDTASLVEYIADPMEVQYTYVDAWQDRPEIQIFPDYTVIDGVEYTDIWISNEAAEKFRVNAFDFKTAYNIASQSNGTFASGAGNYDGVPLFSVNNTIRSQDYIVEAVDGSHPIGNTSAVVSTAGANTKNINWYNSNNSNIGYKNNLDISTDYPLTLYFQRNSYNQLNPRIKQATGVYTNGANIAYNNALWDHTSFSFDYVAGEIPTDTQLPADTGMMIRIPSNDPVTQEPYFDDWLTDNPEFNQGQPVTIDINLDPNIEAKLDDLLDIIIPIMPIINNNLGDIQFIENHSTPTPPVPDTLLPDTYWSQLENKLDQIRQTIQNLNPDFSQIIQNIQTIPSAITQAVSNITQTISNLGDTILRDIEEGPIRLLDKLIDVLRNLFFPILATLRGFLGIWHYVVTWMSNISAPFAWIMGLMAGASPILVSPIYALIAGIIVIAVYRRFGR